MYWVYFCVLFLLSGHNQSSLSQMAKMCNTLSFSFKMGRRSLLRLARLTGREWLARGYAQSAEGARALTTKDIGRFYEVEKAQAEQLGFPQYLPNHLRKQIQTLDECVLMARHPLIELTGVLDAVHTAIPAIKTVLWGPFGTGKSVSLAQALHCALLKEFVLIYLPSAMELTRKVREVEMSSVVPSRINDPHNAVAILQRLKQQNAHIWKRLSELPVSRSYEWSKVERTNEGGNLGEMIELGISSPLLASDCVGGVFRELRLHASAGRISLLLAIDDANSLFGRTLVKRADNSYAAAHDLTLIEHFRRLLQADWSNGAIMMVADKKELSDARDKVTVPRNTPLELFGEEGFEHIEPFIPIETRVYSREEAGNMYEYLLEKQWLTSPNARSEVGKEQIMHLSAFNPFHFERICAFT